MSTSVRDALQTSLGSAYSIERELGGGGMSRVFVAEETAFKRRVVVKLLSPELVAGVNVDRFKREIQVAARLQHPHIVPVITAGESGGLPYYIMPFVEGESLRARLAGGALPMGDTVSILRDVARALVYAHDHGIVHRDIKPDNVLLAHGTATVADFGIAKALTAAKTQEGGATLTQIGVSIGTPAYMAPEQAAGDPEVDHRADIYAFGCMAYEMLAGRPPFDAKSSQRLFAAHMSEKPQSVSELRADAPKPLADLVMQCLEKEPDRRPQSAAELVPTLQSVASGETHTSSLRARAPRTRTARWGLYGLGAFVLFAVVATLMRIAAVGPFATLLSAGELQAGDKVIVAELTTPAGSDSTLGRVISEAIKTDLDQSSAVSFLPDAEVARTLTEMRQRDGRLLLPAAREVAQRRGLKAIVDGSLTPLGTGFIVKLRVVTTDSLRELASFTGAADSPSQLIEVVGRLTRKLRGKMGESLKSVRDSRPLNEATTSSLAALRKFTEARDQIRNSADRAAYLRLMQEAIAIDSNFALAYAGLATTLSDLNIHAADIARYSAKAFALRERLADRDRAIVSYNYYRSGPVDGRNPALADAYVDSVAIFSMGTSMASVGMVYRGNTRAARGDLVAAESLYRAAWKGDTLYSVIITNLFGNLRRQGRLADAESTFHEIERRFPSVGAMQRPVYLLGRGDVPGAIAAGQEAYDRRKNDPYSLPAVAATMVGLAEHRGNMRDAETWSERGEAARAEIGVAGARLFKAAATAQRLILAYGDTAAAVRVLDQALAVTPIESIELLDRPYREIGSAYAAAGRTERAKTYLAGVQRQFDERDSQYGYRVHLLRAEIAMAERRWGDALRDLPANLPARCSCLAVPRAAAYDGRGDLDSALVWYLEQAKFVGAPGLEPVLVARRIGEIYSAKGDASKAIMWYQRFVDAWKEAEPRLQPQVADVRQRIARLQEAERRAR